MSSKKFDLKELRFEQQEYLKELKQIRDGIDSDYFNFTLSEKAELYKLFNKQISFIEGVVNTIANLIEELNTSTEETETKQLEDRALKLFNFLLEELDEKQKEIDEILNNYFTGGS